MATKILFVMVLLFTTTLSHPLVPTKPENRIIINGRAAADGEFPYQVSIQRKAYWGDGSSHICGAAIIDEHHVLTAAHCIYEQFISMLVVVAGTRDVSGTTDPNRVKLDVEDAYMHEDFYEPYYFNDIALVRVTPGFPLNNTFVEPIPMREEMLEEPAECTVTGWGTTQVFPREFPDILQALDLPFLDYELCSELYEDYEEGYIIPGMLCAGYLAGGKDACQADSGGPLVCGGQLSGIVSWGESCALPNYPGIYADVAYYRDWIRNTLARSYEEGGLQERSFQ